MQDKAALACGCSCMWLLLQLLTLASVSRGSLASLMVPRLAIINESPAHLEVVAGFISTLQRDYGQNMQIYMDPSTIGPGNDLGLTDFLQGEVDPERIQKLPMWGAPVQTLDLAIFITPEDRTTWVRDFLRMSKIKVVIMIIHDAEAVDVPLLLTYHSNVHLFTLSPHYQHSLAQRLGTHVDWMLPTKGLMAKEGCPRNNLTGCLSGYVIQGSIDSTRRNYMHVFMQLDRMIKSGANAADPRLQLHLVGKDKDIPEQLTVPPLLRDRIHLHNSLMFPDFYELIYNNLAILPAFASRAFLKVKFSSSVITSLVTGVPLVADDRFMAAYSFLKSHHVARQWDSETLADVLARLLRGSNIELASARDALAALRVQLRAQALSKINALLEPFMAQIKAEWDANPW